MKSKKLIIFSSAKVHFWQSLQIIELHMLEAFKYCQTQIEVMQCQDHLSDEQSHYIKTINLKYDLYFFFLSDSLILQNLVEKLITLTNGHYIIPIYGNMTMELWRWQKLDKLLQGLSVLLLGASHRSCQQIQAFCNEGMIKKLPYPFSTTIVKKPKSFETIDLIYAGRITPQKNILTLIQAFLDAKTFNQKLRLHIAGNFHERQWHLHGLAIDFKTFQQKFYAALEQSKESIIYHGELEQESLLALYAQMDYFISLSTYHDEDYGMSAAQAYSMGLPLLLSDWGGHASFSQAVLFPVYYNDNLIPKVSSLHVTRTLIKLNRPSMDISSPKFCSLEKFAKAIDHIVQHDMFSPFKGLSDLYHQYLFKALKGYPFSSQNSVGEDAGHLYHQIYQNYAKDIMDPDQFDLEIKN
jgi:hypothetical protein